MSQTLPNKITVKEFKDGTHEDNFEKGKIRQSYLDKLEKLNKNNQSNEDEKILKNYTMQQEK